MANDKVRLVFACSVMAALAVPAMWAQEVPKPAAAGQENAATGTQAAAAPVMPEPPAKEPKVTCKGDQITISADNSTLGSILAAVRACSGIQVEVPDGAISSSRTFGELGPGSERQVLDALLDGASFDYVIQSSDSNPQKVSSVVLMARATTGAGESGADRSAMSPARRAWVESRKNLHGAAGTAVPEDGPTAEEPPARTEAEDAPAAPAEAANPAPAPPAAVPAGDQPPAANPDSAPVLQGPVPSALTTSPTEMSGSNPAVNSDKSTAERISDMQQMFQQRKQLNQNPVQSPNPTPQQPQ